MREAPGLVTITRARKRLDVSRRTIYRFRDRGLLEIVYLGPGMPRIREADLDRLATLGGISQRTAA